MNNSRIIWIRFILVLSTIGCSDYLELKPDYSFSIPNSIEDLEGLLDNSENVMNLGTPGLGEVAADNYYLTEASWNSLSGEDDRSLYLWKPYSPVPNQWITPYGAILHANTVLEYLPSIEIPKNQHKQAEYIKGSAYFHRAYQVFHLLHVFAKPYDPNKINDQLGVVLRREPSLDEKLIRSSVEECYEFVVDNLKKAVALLPNSQSLKTRPSKASAYAELARVYLVKGSFEEAGLYADSALKIHSDLLNYETDVNPLAVNPFPKWNKEVLFDASMNGGNLLAPTRMRVSPLKYALYGDGDLRKTTSFSVNDENEILFKGNYNGSNSSLRFCGTTTAEMYLIRAESNVRRNLLKDAEDDINILRKHRFSEAMFEPIIFSSYDQALSLIKEERERELIFRGQRWSDLKRFIILKEFNGNIEHSLDSEKFILTSEEVVNYVYRLPDRVIDNGDLEQNE